MVEQFGLGEVELWNDPHAVDVGVFSVYVIGHPPIWGFSGPM